MEQQTDVLLTLINNDCLHDKRSSLLSGSSNKRLKGSLLRTLVRVKWLLEFYASTTALATLETNRSLNSYETIHASNL